MATVVRPIQVDIPTKRLSWTVSRRLARVPDFYLLISSYTPLIPVYMLDTPYYIKSYSIPPSHQPHTPFHSRRKLSPAALPSPPPPPPPPIGRAHV